MPSNNAVNSSSGGAPIVTSGTTVSAAPKGLRQKVSQLLAGMEAVIPDGSSAMVGGQTIAKADLVTQMTQIIAVYQTYDAAAANTKGLGAQLKAQGPGFHKQYLDIKDAMVSFLGRGNPQLAQLGIKVSRAPKPLTPEQRVVRTTKAKATRELRHTMSKKQKAAVQYAGSVQVSVSKTPVADPANGATNASSPVVTQDTAVAATPAATPGPASGHTQ